MLMLVICFEFTDKSSEIIQKEPNCNLNAFLVVLPTFFFNESTGYLWFCLFWYSTDEDDDQVGDAYVGRGRTNDLQWTRLVPSLMRIRIITPRAFLSTTVILFFQRCFHRNRFPLTKKTSTHDTSSARWQSGRDQRSTPCMWPAFCLSLSFCLVDQRSTKSLACQNPNNLVPSEPSTSKSRKKKMCFTTKKFQYFLSNSTDEARIGRYAPGDGFWFHVRSLARKMVLRNIKSVNIKPHQETMLTLHSSKRINKTEKAPCCPVQRHVTNAMTEILPFSAAYDDRK